MNVSWLSLLFFLPILFILAIFGILIFVISRTVRASVKQRRANEAAPVLSFPARVIGKRDMVSGGESATGTRYFVTFERLDLQRIELEVQGQEFGMLVPGDVGRLTHQGTWYQGFQRDPAAPSVQA